MLTYADVCRRSMRLSRESLVAVAVPVGCSVVEVAAVKARIAATITTGKQRYSFYLLYWYKKYQF
jgi:hypothetical protein